MSPFLTRLTRPLRHLMLVGLLLGAWVACDTSPTDTGACGETATARDPETQRLQALLALVQSFHAQADVAAAAEDLPRAEASIQALIQTLNASTLEHPERLDFLLDAYGRLARLQWQQAQPDRALATVSEGLALAPDDPKPRLFRGYLLQLRGDLLRSKGDDRGAVEAHKEAIQLFKAILDKQGSAP